MASSFEGGDGQVVVIDEVKCSTDGPEEDGIFEPVPAMSTSVSIPTNILGSAQNVRAEDVKGDIVLDVAGIEDKPPPDEDDLVPPCGEKGILVEIDAKNFRVMQGREKKEPYRKRVDAIKRAIEAKREVRRVLIYQDAKTDDKYSPNGGHRQQAYDELKKPVPAILFKVRNAMERAELESCFANESNGKDRSDADKRFQAKKAIGILQKKLCRPPKPKELAHATHTSLKFACSCLHAYFAPMTSEEDDEEPDTTVPSSLKKILDGLKKVEPPDDWASGYKSEPLLADIEKEIQRLKKHMRPDPEISPDAIISFIAKHNLNMPQMAKLVEVSPVTVKRWLTGSTKIHGSNARILRQVMLYTSEQIQAFLDEDHTDCDRKDRDE